MKELNDIKSEIGKIQKPVTITQITTIEESKSLKIIENEESTAYPRLPCFHDPAIQQTRFGMHVFKKDTYKVKGF